MKAKITVREFCENYLDPTDTVVISDFDTEHVYYRGKVSDILKDTGNIAFNIFIVKISVSYSFEHRIAINFEV